MFPMLPAVSPPVLELTGRGEKVNMQQAGRNTTELTASSNFTCPTNQLLSGDTQTKTWPTALTRGCVPQLYRTGRAMS